jgi:Peptidase A4 family
MSSGAAARFAFAHDETAFRARIPYPLVTTNLQGVYASLSPSGDFDPNKVSACELVKNGLLWRRPCTNDVPALQRAWQRVFSREWRAKNRIVPELHPQLGRSHALRKAMKKISDTSFVSSAWAGAGTRGGSWTGIIGFWKIPAVTKLTEQEIGWRCSSWVGIDGFDVGIGSNDLLHAGIERCVSADGVASCVAWFEWCAPAQAASPPYVHQTNIANFPVSAGQDIFCSVQYIGNRAGYIYFANETTGQHFSVTLAPPPGATFSGNSAEWIVEAPQASEVCTALPRFGPVAFTSAIACSSSGALGNPKRGDTVDVEDASGGILASVEVADYAAAIDFTGQRRDETRPRSARTDPSTREG